jgi:hypothetical protein
VATLSEPTVADPSRFALLACMALNHPGFGICGDVSALVYVAIRTWAAQARRQIVSRLKQYAVDNLEIHNVAMAKDRVAVVL